MGTRDAGDRAVRALRRRPERVALALDDEGGDADGVEFVEAALFRAARRVEREREAQDGDRVGLGCGSACDAGAQRSAAAHDGKAAQGTVA
jgi:hypothetical protein